MRAMVQKGKDKWKPESGCKCNSLRNDICNVTYWPSEESVTYESYIVCAPQSVFLILKINKQAT